MLYHLRTYDRVCLTENVDVAQIQPKSSRITRIGISRLTEIPNWTQHNKEQKMFTRPENFNARDPKVRAKA